VTKIILTHKHSDHSGEIRSFPNAKFYVNRAELEELDLKTSSWIATPDEIRQKGGALFCEKRYGVVFTFHNGADSYYAARGWRGYFSIT
jgi:glyoxylase-like metal-dependent hydrolase (beta-lactamase superfamily II)